MIHGDGFSFESTRYPKPVSTQSHNSQKLLVSTRYTPKNSRGLHDIKADILKLVYHPPRMFVWAFRTRGWVSRTWLIVYSKRIAIFAVKKTK